MHELENIRWFHSIDLGGGVVTRGIKSAEQLTAEFDVLGLTAENLRGRRLLDIGCNDGYMSLQCARLGADVTAIDGVYRESLKYVRQHAETKFRFYCIDLLSPSFFELGRFDVILHLGVLYHTIYPFEHFKRLASASADGATVMMETEFYNLPGCEDGATVFYDYGQNLSADWTSPVYPSIKWISETFALVGFEEVTLLSDHTGGGQLPGQPGGRRGRATLRARYAGGKTAAPFLYAGEQAV